MVGKNGIALSGRHASHETHGLLGVRPETLLPVVLVAEAALFALAAASGKIPPVLISLVRALLTI